MADYYNIQAPPSGVNEAVAGKTTTKKSKSRKTASVESPKKESLLSSPPPADIPGVGGISKLVEDYQRDRPTRRFRDVFWGVLFFAHLAVIAYSTAHYVPLMTLYLSEDYAGAGAYINSNVDDQLNGEEDVTETQYYQDYYMDKYGYYSNSNGNKRRHLEEYYDGKYTQEYYENLYSEELSAEEKWQQYVDQRNGVAQEEEGGGEDESNDDTWRHGQTWQRYHKNGTLYHETVKLDLGVTLSLVAFNGITGFVASSMALVIMMTHAERMIRGGMMASVALSLFLGIFCLFTERIAGALFGLIVCGLLIWYAMRVWSLIPFAAANLETAATAVRANLGVTIYAYLTLAVAFGWAVWWTASSVSTIFVEAECEGDGTCNKAFNWWMILGFLLSYYWTTQVLNNVVGVTAAGVIGTWWYSPSQAASFCSGAVQEAFQDAITHSFGSICLGSLFVTPVSALRYVVFALRDSENSFLFCIAECLLYFVENILNYFNEYGYVFVGIYGFSYTEAGIQVVDVFQNRGWQTIILDDLTDHALMIISFVVALLNGLIGLSIGTAIRLGTGVPSVVPFLIGFFTGLTLCMTLFSVVGSACKSVVVLYAEAPNKFDTNHPELSAMMRERWFQAWPMDFNY